MKTLITSLVALTLTALPAFALDFSFPSIDGGTVEMSDWEGRPVLVVNTASRRSVSSRMVPRRLACCR